MDRTIEIAGLPEDLLTRLDDQASQIGVDRNSYVRRLIERAVAPPCSWKPLSELLAPVHDFTEAHGISEAELERFFREQIAETRRERRTSDQGDRPAR